MSGLHGGTPTKVRPPLSKRSLRRIAQNVSITEDVRECWLWTASLTKHGYGQISLDGERYVAPRAMYEAWHGAPIPSGAWVLHSCDNPACCNPFHLRLGTAKDNSQDRERRGRGRAARGMGHALAKVSDDDVRAIRALAAAGTMSQWQIGRLFGITQSTVSQIHLRKKWRHVEEA